MSTLYVVNHVENQHIAFNDGYQGFSRWCKLHGYKPSIVYKRGENNWMRVTKVAYKLFIDGAEDRAPSKPTPVIDTDDHMTYGAAASQMYAIGDTNGCSIISLAVAANVPYHKVNEIAHRIANRKIGHGMTLCDIKCVAQRLIIGMRRVHNDEIDSKNRTTAQVLRQLDNTKMYMIVQKRHVFTVKAGEMHDWAESGSRRRCQSVYEMFHSSFA